MFNPDFIKFFESLSKNNNRIWFNEHKSDYQKSVVKPMIEFIEAMAPRLKKISPKFKADPRPIGGSMFRIFRDLRFSNDKTPYKLHAACQFRHELGKDAHTPGFYVHFSPDEIVFGGGIWIPPNSELNKIRNTIVENPQAWESIKTDKTLKKLCGGVNGDGLKRPPRGFDPEHQHIDDLKRKSFFAMRRENPEIIFQQNFIDEVVTTFKATKPLMKYICFAQDIDF
jgi:uncharacterized protein (TIGR02453 family)